MQLDDEQAARMVGSTGRADLIVGALDTAIAAGSGDLPVLATPRMVALMEEAACHAVASYLPPGLTSVGTRIEVRHRAPTPVGATVSAVAVVLEATGARLAFEVTASQVVDGVESPIGDGTHTRVVVDRATFAPPPPEPGRD